MAFSYSTSLSGLAANSNALGVAGNNIANANTIGFRSSSIVFGDVFANSTGVRLNGAGSSLGIGSGVRTEAIHTNFSQGSISESGSPLHAAIQGNGFFTLSDANGFASYTRAGDFTINKEGFLVNPTGAQVQGYQAVNGEISSGATISAMKLPLGETLPPQITSDATFRMNLDSQAPTGAVFHSTMEVYDSRGAAHTLDLAYTKQADGSFNMLATVDGNAANTSADGAAAAATPVNFTFNTSGQLTSPTTVAIVPNAALLGGATMPSINVRLRETNPDGTPGAFNMTSFARPSAVAATIQNGYTAGELVGASVDTEGVVSGVFSNGQSRVIGQFALATFNAPEGLNRLGGNAFSETISSGQATIGAANTGGRGSIAGGSLEQSNVDITNEFIELIEAQRGFQANSRVITTLNQTFQDLLQMV